MTRREQLENIIIGSLINDFNRYWPEVRDCVTEDMMGERNGRLYRRMTEISANGKTPTLEMLTDGDDWKDIALLAIDNDFAAKKAEYNICQHLGGNPPRYTDVEFVDYVNAYLTYER